MELHTLKAFKGAKKARKRVGRGLGSGHGAYSTRGVKGQRARSGGSKGLKARGVKMFLLRVPKIGGFTSIHQKAHGVNIELLEKHFSSGDTVTPTALIEKGVVRVRGLRKIGTPTVDVKILSSGKLTKKLTIRGCDISAPARVKIEKAGGTVEERTSKPKQVKHKKTKFKA